MKVHTIEECREILAAGVMGKDREAQKLAGGVMGGRMRVDSNLTRLESGLERILREVKTARQQFEDGNVEPLSLASRIQHEVLWGVANLDLDGLTKAAGELQVAEALLEELL